MSDPDAYYVNHLSRYEHFLHEKYGFDVAHNRTRIMSEVAW